MHRTEDKQRIQWEVMVSAIAIVVTILGVVVPLFIHVDNKTYMTVEAIRQDVRDFHGKLCAIEEKYKQMERK